MSLAPHISKSFTPNQESILKIAVLSLPGVIERLCGLADDEVIELMRSRSLGEPEALKLRSAANWILASYRRTLGESFPLLLASPDRRFLEWTVKLMQAVRDQDSFLAELEPPSSKPGAIAACKQRIDQTLCDFEHQLSQRGVGHFHLVIDDSVYPELIFQVGEDEAAQRACIADVVRDKLIAGMKANAPIPTAESPLVISAETLRNFLTKPARS